jgi:hypothetical protein
MTASNRPTPDDDQPGPATAALILQGTELLDEVRLLRKAVDRQRRMQTLLIVGVVLAILGFGRVAIDNNARIAELKQQMCGAVVGIVPAPGEAPPPAGKAGERARDVIGRFRVLATDFECTLRQ